MKLKKDAQYLAVCVGAMCFVAKAGGEHSDQALSAVYENIDIDPVLSRAKSVALDCLLVFAERLDRDFLQASSELLTRIKALGMTPDQADDVLGMALAVLFSETEFRREQVDAIGYLASALDLNIYDYLTGGPFVTH